MEDSAATTTSTSVATTTFHAPPNQNQNGTTTPQKYSHLNLDTLSYTSLKDMLPFTAAAVNSPTASSSSSSSAAGGISIRNRLVKQAAWAYLQPMSGSPCGPSGPHVLHRLRIRFSSDGRDRRRNVLAPCLKFVSHLVACFTRVLHQILDAIRGQVPILCFCV